MINLEKYSGLPIEMNDDFVLQFGPGIEAQTPKIREFPFVKNYLKNPHGTYHRRDVYHIYRDVAFLKDKDKIHRAGLEYDLTVIPPGKIGDEFVKTLGHYHPYKKGAEVRYPEIYEVVYSKAFFVLQSASADLLRLQDVYIVEAGRGEKVLVPPGFGHVSINPTENVLVLANWQPLNNQGIYEPYEAHNGAAYYVVQSDRLGKGGRTVSEYEFAPNLNYASVPAFKRVRGRELPRFSLLSALPMYFTGIRNLETLDFLVHPENYLDELVPEKLFK